MNDAKQPMKATNSMVFVISIVMIIHRIVKMELTSFFVTTYTQQLNNATRNVGAERPETGHR